MLVNATEMLLKARDGHYGVPQFNINNLEWTSANRRSLPFLYQMPKNRSKNNFKAIPHK